MKAVVQFVGAGPGAEDLITVRGLRLLREADLVIYAGSLVSPGHLEACKPGCRCLDSASMDLGQQVEAMSTAALAGEKVVRLHTGDPAMYGAINEQIRLLAQKGVECVVTPGVSSVFAAAAALGRELTRPDGSQSLVLTRTPGRTPMPESEDAAAFARTGATLAFFLSAGNVDATMRRLMKEGGLAPETPAAVVYRASWPDQRILRGTVSDIARQTEEAGIGRQALILVVWSLEDSGGESRLYGSDFSHGYRNHLATEAFEGRCALYTFTSKGLVRAREIAAGLGLPTRIFSTKPCDDEDVTSVKGEDFNKILADHWAAFDAHIFIGATGIAVRKIAPLLRDKTSDPAVLTCAESGSHVVSLTSGHIGGANRLARRVARITGGQAVISTATDVNGLPAFDDIAAQEQARILNTRAIRTLNGALLAGENIAFCGSKEIFDRHFGSGEQVIFVEKPEEVKTSCAVLWDAKGTLPTGVQHLDLCSRSLVLGVGCHRGAEPDRLRRVAEDYLAAHRLTPRHIAAIASCDVKADEEAILRLGDAWGVPLHFYPAAELNAVQVPTPSKTVHGKVGTGSVSEASCLLSAGYGSQPQPVLCAPKSIFGDITLALARLPHLPGNAERNRGKLTVVGLGSGSAAHITPEVDAALRSCDVVAGYGPYVDFIRDRVAGKPVIQNGMKAELERCKAALESALQGNEVCMVCSGDPGILAMAGLLLELRGREPRYTDIEINILPGITSANIAAASLGAPLQNGFCLVSLSDMLIPTDEVRRNLQAVAQSALPVALYNPAGRKRRHMLAEALAVFREKRGDHTCCAYVREAGRPNERKWLGRLGDFPEDEVDMSTLLIIGGPRSVIESGVFYEARGYVEKYLQDREA